METSALRQQTDIDGYSNVDCKKKIQTIQKE
jgi:hypothetical protein